MPDRRGWNTQSVGWMVLAYGEALALVVFAWVLLHQVSPPVIEACVPGTPTRVVAPPFDRNGKP